MSGLQITPEINRFISFIREKYLAALYIPPLALQLGGLKFFHVRHLNEFTVPGARHLQRELDMGFEYPKTAPGWLCCHLSGLMQMFPALDTEETRLILSKCRAESYQLLREEISRDGAFDVTNISLIIQIVYMFKSGLMENQPENAQVHTWALQKIAEMEDATLCAQLFMCLMHNDVEFSVHMMRPTLLDFNGWISQKLESIWAVEEAALPDIGSEYQNIHPSLDNHMMRDALIRARRCISLSSAERALDLTKPKDFEVSELLYIHFANRTHHDSGLLVNHYLAFVDESSLREGSSAGSLYVDAALTLTTLYSIRTYIQRATLQDVDIRNASYVIMPRLKDMLQTALERMTQEERAMYQHALFWMYFNGAHYEECVRRGLVHAGSPISDDWFSQMLATSARDLGASRWADGRFIVSSFIYDDFLTPNPEEWYESVVVRFRRGTILPTQEYHQTSVLHSMPVRTTLKPSDL